MTDFATARFNMVEGQIRPNKVTDERLLEALSTVPRERFVPASARGVAYVDGDIAVGRGRFLLEPMVLGRMLQAAAVGPADSVLDLGCATGYSTAVLARLAARVIGLDSDEALAAEAAAALAAVGASNAKVARGALSEGWAAEAPYDVIFINGGVAEIPSAVANQLAEGGRIVAPVVRPRGVGEVRLFQRAGGVLSSRVLFEAQPDLLPGLEPVPAFEF